MVTVACPWVSFGSLKQIPRTRKAYINIKTHLKNGYLNLYDNTKFKIFWISCCRLAKKRISCCRIGLSQTHIWKMEGNWILLFTRKWECVDLVKSNKFYRINLSGEIWISVISWFLAFSLLPNREYIIEISDNSWITSEL